jgi:hypothetical protein
MKRSWWCQAATFALLLSVISLPAWASKPKPAPCLPGDPACKTVPEGGPSYIYILVSGLATCGGVLLAKKKRSGTVHPLQG